MHPAELAVQRLNTEAFIKADPVSLIIHRRVKTRNAAGGYVWDSPHGTPLAAPQIFRLLPMSLAGTHDEVRDSSGRMVKPRYRILGLHNADIARWDLFHVNGLWYEVATPPVPLHTATSIYQTKAEVVAREDL